MVAALIDTLYLAGKEEKCFLIPVRMYPVPTSLTWIQAVQSHSGVSLEKKCLNSTVTSGRALKDVFRSCSVSVVLST